MVESSRTGFRPSDRVKSEGFLDLICGRIYLNTQRHAEFFWSGFPWEYDIEQIKKDPAQAETTRRKTYDMLVAEKMRVQGFHYPFPGLGNVVKDGSGYRLVPAQWNPVI